MSRFKRIKNTSTKKSSVSIDEKIDALNQELEKTGMSNVSEMMTTDNVLSSSEYVPPQDRIEGDVPNSSGIGGDGFTQSSAGSGTEGHAPSYSSLSDLYNTDVGHPIYQTPSSNNVPVSFGVVSYNLSGAGTNYGIIEEGNIVRGVLGGFIAGGTRPASYYVNIYNAYLNTNQNNPGFYSDEQIESKRVEAELAVQVENIRIQAQKEGREFNIPWQGYRSPNMFADSTPYGTSYTHPTKGLLILAGFNLLGMPNRYTSQEPRPATTTNPQRRGLEDDPIFPGPIATLFGLGQRAFDWLRGKAESAKGSFDNIVDKAKGSWDDFLDNAQNFGDKIDMGIEEFIDDAINWAKDKSGDVKDWAGDFFGKDSDLWEIKDAIGDRINALDNWVEDNITDIGGIKRQIFTDFAETVSNWVGEAQQWVTNKDITTSVNLMNDFNQHGLDMINDPNTPGSSWDNPKDVSDRIDKGDMNALNDVQNSDKWNDEIAKYKTGKTIDGKPYTKELLEMRLTGFFEEVIYARPGLDQSIHNGSQITNIDDVIAGENAKIGKQYDFNEGDSVKEGEENPALYAYSQIMNLPLDAFGTGGDAGLIAWYAKVLGLSNADRHNGILNMPPMVMSITVGGNNNSESFRLLKHKTYITEQKITYKPIGKKSKIKAKFESFKKKHYGKDKLSLYDFLPSFASVSKKVTNKNVKESLNESVGLGLYEPEAMNVDLADIRKGIMPEYPKKPPAEMIDGYHEKSRIRPKKAKNEEPYLKIDRTDLIRSHRLKKSEADEMMDTINMINDYIRDNPADLIHAQQRYPVDDPRLAELNWKMDQMLDAGKEYMDSNFKENKKLYKRATEHTLKNIKLTDPKYVQQKYDELRGTIKPKRSINKRNVSRFFKKPVNKKSSMEEIDDKIKQLDKDLLL